MQLPLQIVQLGEQRVNRVEQTLNISSGGVCFQAALAIDPGVRIEYLITLSGTQPPVRIRCLGKVLRCQLPSGREISEDAPCEIAVTMERYQFIRAEELEPQFMTV